MQKSATQANLLELELQQTRDEALELKSASNTERDKEMAAMEARETARREELQSTHKQELNRASEEWTSKNLLLQQNIESLHVELMTANQFNTRLNAERKALELQLQEQVPVQIEQEATRRGALPCINVE